MERPAGNDPASSRWQREALPLSYGRVVGRDRVELPQRRGGAFTAPWVRQYPAYACWLRRAESNGLSHGHEPSELPVLHSASNLVGSPRRGAPPDRRSCEKLAEGRGLDPQWLPIHHASNGRLAPAGLTFRIGQGSRLRSCGLLRPRQALFQAELYPVVIGDPWENRTPATA